MGRMVNGVLTDNFTYIAEHILDVIIVKTAHSRIMLTEELHGDCSSQVQTWWTLLRYLAYLWNAYIHVWPELRETPVKKFVL